MKRTLKWIGGAIMALVVVILVVGYFLNEPRPIGKKGQAAEELTDRMMASVNCGSWDTLQWVEWSFMGRHHYRWDKKASLVEVSWKDYKVILNTETLEGEAFSGRGRVEGTQEQELLDDAWSRFCNDSFWLNAVCKARDPGTERSIVTLEEGRTGLMIEYTSGGVTPGDAYVWILDESGRPTAYKMWVGILPVGGLKATWGDWVETPQGIWLATSHEMGKVNVEITNIKTAKHWQELYEKHPINSML